SDWCCLVCYSDMVYENRVFVVGVIFRINSFDQCGVELGKELATGLLPVVEGKESAPSHDSSTKTRCS
ncbi:hypothetical protein ACCT11_35980, partial [Rhizobium johnstonii]|uniref:hypothetical protein n=1 Tax=Rhizobium johnstonii TaxID=3019933 RepID=UPI003F9886BF